jgi:hypothetical protein
MFANLYRKLFSRHIPTPIPKPVFVHHPRAPLFSDDDAFGLPIGSRWVNVISGTMYVSVDSSVGAAVWLEVGATGVVCDPGSIGTTGDTGLASWYDSTGEIGDTGWDMTGPHGPCGVMPKLSMWGPDDEYDGEIQDDVEEEAGSSESGAEESGDVDE